MDEKIKDVLFYCCSKPHARHEFKQAWDADVVTVGGKIFAMLGKYKDGRSIATLKADPEKAIRLREAYEGIVIPGYYSNKAHWNSIFLDTETDESLVKTLVDDSYELIYGTLTRKARAELESSLS